MITDSNIREEIQTKQLSLYESFLKQKENYLNRLFFGNKELAKQASKDGWVMRQQNIPTFLGIEDKTTTFSVNIGWMKNGEIKTEADLRNYLQEILEKEKS